jgi:hypothetical protein
MIEPEQVVTLYHQRRTKRQPMMDKRVKVLEQYNGETVVPMPELDQQQKPAVANLLGLGLDQFAQRIGSVLPDIDYPSLREGYSGWDEKARVSRLANLGWWKMNRMDLLAYKRARYLLAFAGAPVTIHPVSAAVSDKRQIPHWRIRSPLNCFPAPTADELDYEPADYVVAHEYPLWWLEDNYPGPAAMLYKGRQSGVSRDMTFEVLEYNDADETVLVACGATRDERAATDWTTDTEVGSAAVVLLKRIPNRAQICNMVFPGRIVLDKPIGHFDTMLHLFTSQAKMAAYEELAMFRSIFPDTWIMSHPNAPTKPRIVRDADGKQGVIGIVENGVVQPITLNPGAQVPTAIDRLERAARLAGGIPAEFGGEAASNIRTGRRGAQVMGDTVDMPLQEYQQIFAASYDAENLRAVRTMKSYYGKSVSMYVIPRDGKIAQVPGNPQTYVPDEIFVSDYSKCDYPFLGSDASSIPIEIGQRVGTTEMSLQTAREKDPKIDDPVLEAQRVISEGLEKALLGGIEQQLAGGTLDPVVAAKLEVAMRANPTARFADIYVKVHEQMQEDQASQQAAQPAPVGGGGATPPAPATMPGAAVPPGGAQPQPLNPPPGQGQQNLAQLVSSLGQSSKPLAG